MWKNRLKLFSYTVDKKGSLFGTVSAQKVHFHPHRQSQKRSLLLATVWWRQCDGEGLQCPVAQVLTGDTTKDRSSLVNPLGYITGKPPLTRCSGQKKIICIVKKLN